MADNIAVTPGTGATVAADDVTPTGHSAGGLVQFVKIVDGTSNGTAPIAVAAGTVANAMRVTLGSDDPTVVDLAAIEVLLGTIDADTGSLAIVGGGAEATALRVTIANDSTGVVTVDGTVTANLSATDNAVLDAMVVDLAALEVDLAAIEVLLGTIDTDTGVIAGDTTSIDGKITACNTGAVVLSSGTVTTVSTVTAVTSLDKSVYVDDADWTDDTSSHTLVGGIYQSTPHTVTDGDVSPFQLDVNGKLITIAELSATDNAVLDAIDTVLDLINAKLVTGTVIGDVNLGATDNAVLDSIVTNTTRAAITGYGQAKLDHADVTTAQVLIAAVADKKFYITSLILSVATAGSYWIEDDDAVQITCKYTLAANGGVAATFPIDTPFKSTTANKGLKVKGSAAGVIGCMITYYTLA